MEVLHQYKNGNTQVTLYDDGSKKREFEGGPKPEYPESIDIKITDYCDAGCTFCHESSTVKGVHGDLEKLLDILAPVNAGVELAIGGGAPQKHPNFLFLLQQIKKRNWVSNLTINQKHLRPDHKLTSKLLFDKLIYGLGISYTSESYIQDIEPLLNITDNIVFHLIIGINKLEDIDKLLKFCRSKKKTCKILILGYKQFGFGINYYLKNKKIEDNKYKWYTELPRYFRIDDLILSFDNLALEQLKVKRFLTEEAWNQFYMGNDYQFSMYIDAVKQQYAASSTSNNRVSFNECSLFEFFQRGK